MTSVGDLLRANIDDVVQDWLDALRATPHIKRQKVLPDVQVKDGVASILLNLADVLDDSERFSLFEEGGPVHQHAAAVGELRKEQGYQVHELAQDYLVLRTQLWDFFEHKVDPEQVDFFQLEELVNAAIDKVLVTTMSTFHVAQTDELRRLAERDSLTGVYHHAFLHGALAKETRRSVRYGRPSSLVMIDIDDFKGYNDTHGHLKGDRALRVLGEVLVQSTRDVDISARYGGDEFAVLAPETPKSKAVLMARRIAWAFAAKAKEGDGLEQALTLSLGVATCPEDGSTKDELIDTADRALYAAKEETGSHIVVARGDRLEAAEEG